MGLKLFVGKGLRVVESGERFAQFLKALFGKDLRIFYRERYCNFLMVYCKIKFVRANVSRKLNRVRVLKFCS